MIICTKIDAGGSNCLIFLSYKLHYSLTQQFSDVCEHWVLVKFVEPLFGWQLTK